MIFAAVTFAAYFVVAALLIIGAIWVFALANAEPRRVISWGVGASLGGLIAMLSVDKFGATYLRLAQDLLARLGLLKVVTPLSNFAAGAFALSVLFCGMALGGFLMSRLVDRWTRKDDKDI